MVKACVTGKEPYFTLDPDSANQDVLRNDVFCLPLEIIIQNIVTFINDRHQNAETYESSMTELLASLTNQAAANDFLAMLNEVRAIGNVVMVVRKDEHHQYHNEVHSAEISHDTALELKNKLPGNRLDHLLIRSIATAAAAWHDVIQDRSPLNNEHESAMIFEAYLDKKIQSFLTKHPACLNAVISFQKQLSFIARELIVYNTCLVTGKESKDNNKPFSKSLRQHAMRAAQKLGISFAAGPHLQHLFLAAEVIEKNDTRRFAAMEIVEEFRTSSIFNKLQKSTTQPLNDFFDYAEQQYPALFLNQRRHQQEVFLGLLSQCIRMFPELNQPPTAKISIQVLQQFINILNTLRTIDNPHYHSHVNYKEIFDLFLSTLDNNGMNNLDREIRFALAQQQEIWTTHAALLALFNTYYKTLDYDQKNKLGFCLLTASTRFQPGIAYLKMDKEFLHTLPIFLKRVRDDINIIESHQAHTSYKRLALLLRTEKNLMDSMLLYHQAKPVTFE